MILNGSAHGVLDLKINTKKQSLKIYPGTFGLFNVIKQCGSFTKFLSTDVAVVP
jgi:hypothetical protein